MSTDEERNLAILIIATVLGGLILTAVTNAFPALASQVPVLVSAIANALSHIWNFLFATIEIPWTVCLVLLFLSTLTVGRFAKPLVTSAVTKPSLDAYRQDIAFNVKWYWTSIKGTQPDDLVGFCPQCQTRIVYNTDWSMWPAEKTTFICDNCKKKLVTIDGDLSEAFYRVKREIERRILTAEWKHALPSETPTIHILTHHDRL